MISQSILYIKPNSHQYLLVECDAKVSPRCKKQIKKMMKTITRDRHKSDGKDLCLYCARQLKYSGRKNPNMKYKTLNDNFFQNIDTEFKAYVLGWIASDGHIAKNNSICISIHKNDVRMLEDIRDNICKELRITKVKKDKMVSLTLNSKQMCEDVIKHLKLEFTSDHKKDHQTQLPDLSTELKWAFIRGYFDGDGSVNQPSLECRYPKCDITSISKLILQQLKDFCNIPCSLTEERIFFNGNNALDFMGKLYDNASFYLSRKRDLYIDWSQWVPSMSGNNLGKELTFRWNKSRPDAVKPKKERASDSGYDLVLLEKVKSFGIVDLYDTGIKVVPEFGWYFDMVPRSSIIKSGYILANSVGIIDRTYTGSVMVPLIKIDPNAPDITPGTRLVQLIPRPIINIQFEEVNEYGDTARGSGGFGSTGV